MFNVTVNILLFEDGNDRVRNYFISNKIDFFQTVLTNTLSNRMWNLRFKRKAKSSDMTDGKKGRKSEIKPLQFLASVKTETSVKPKVSVFDITRSLQILKKRLFLVARSRI